MSSAVYTQTTDVEGEVNGLMTYDSKIIKFDIISLRRLKNKIYNSVPIAHEIIPTSDIVRQERKYTYKSALQNWTRLDFDDREWEKV